MSRTLAMDAKKSVLLLLLLCWTWLFLGSAEEGGFLYRDPNQPLQIRIRDLMDRMTLEEKIGQMAQIENTVSTPANINKYYLGGVVIRSGSPPAPQASPAEWMDANDELQRAALNTRLGIPIIIGIDAIHGHNNLYNATIFPHNIGLGVTRDPELVKKIGEATALEVRATGFPYIFAPCIAVCRDPRWGRCFESYSEDHTIVQSMTELIPGLQGDVPSNYLENFPYVNGRTNVAACAKHFVGDGGTINGIDEFNTVIDWEGLKRIHMPAYIDSIRKGVATIMVSYSSWNGRKMHTNYDLITKYLKDKLKFQGFVVSDSEGIDRITSPPRANYTYCVEASVKAGIDMVMLPYTYVEFIEELTSLVKRNMIPMSRIDDAVERILRVKFILGLFESPYGDRSMLDLVGRQEHRELAREAVRKSLVLLKNGNEGDEPILPLLKVARRILVAGSHAHDIGNQCGGWTIEWHGKSGNITPGTTILTAVQNSVDPDTEVIYQENPDSEFVKSNDFSYAIVVVGELPYSEYVGDSPDLRIPEQGYNTITNVCGGGPTKCVVVVISGRPIVIEPYLDKIDALVAAWLPGTEGQGVADVLFGGYGFTGKLARTWFRRVDQLPMNVGDENYDPLFPFGFGLTTSPRGIIADQ